MNKIFYYGRKVPAEIRRLYELGADEYEVAYLMSLSGRRRIAQKWKKYEPY